MADPVTRDPWHKRAALDFDGTLFTWGPLDGPFTPNPGAVGAARHLKALGYEIIIFTSRMSPIWLASAGRNLYDEQVLVERALNSAGIPWDIITSEKIPCEFYIDDRAVRYRGDWMAAVREALGGS